MAFVEIVEARAALQVLAIGMFSSALACSESTLTLEPLGAPADALSLILAIAGDETLTVEAYSLTDGAPVRRSVEGPRRRMSTMAATALFYRRSLVDLAVPEGVLAPSTSDSVRPLPAFDAAFARDLVSDGDWRPVERLEGRLADFRFGQVDRLSFCLSANGCLAGPSLDAACLAPCPEVSVTEPHPPQPPSFLCDDGWAATSDGSCNPWPLGRQDDCPFATHHLPGTEGCADIGRCPAEEDKWPTGLEALGRPVVYVQADWEGNEAGTKEAPFRSIDDALTSAPEDGVIALSRGTYSGRIRIHRSIDLRGACAKDTLLETAISTEEPIVRIEDAVVRVEGLSIRGNGAGLAVTGATSSATLRGVVIEGNGGAALRVVGAGVDAEDVVIFGVGEGNLVVEGGTLDLNRFSLRLDVRQEFAPAVIVQSGSLTLEDGRLDARAAPRIDAQTGATVTLRHVAITTSSHMGLTGGSYTIEDSVLETPSTSLPWLGLQATTATLARVSVTGVNVYVDETTVARIEDAKFERAQLVIDGRVEVERLRSRGAEAPAIELRASSQATIQDLEVSDVWSREESFAHVLREPPTSPSLINRLIGRRWSIALRDGRAVVIRDDGVLSDIHLIGGPPTSPQATNGLVLGAHVDVERILVSGMASSGIEAVEGAEATLRDVTVTGGTTGVSSRNGALLWMERFSVADVRGPGIQLDDTKDDLFGPSTLTARMGSVAGCFVGAEFPKSDQFIGALDHVRYQANVQDFVASRSR